MKKRMDKIKELLMLLEQKRLLEEKIKQIREEILHEMEDLGLKSRSFVTDHGRFTVSVIERVRVLRKDLLPKEFTKEVRFSIPDAKKIKEKVKELGGIVEVVKDIQIKFKETKNE